LVSASASILAFNPLDAHSLLSSIGTFGLFLVIFAETGLLIGFFLPGDSLLFTAGILCTTRADQTLHLSLPTVLLAAAAGALLGAQVGYLLGRRAGPVLLSSNRPRLRAGFVRAQQALDRYGHPKAIFLARFIPVVRTVLNPLAGAVRVPVRTFHSLAGHRRTYLVCGHHPGGIRARVSNPQYRQVLVTDRGRGCRALIAADCVGSASRAIPYPHVSAAGVPTGPLFVGHTTGAFSCSSI
jgi:membrane-associated protein